MESILFLHRFKLRGVGSVSDAALRMNESWPAGRPPRSRFQTLLSSSNSHDSLNFFWTVRLLRWAFHFSTDFSFMMCLTTLGNVLLSIDSTDSIARFKTSLADLEELKTDCILCMVARGHASFVHLLLFQANFLLPLKHLILQASLN